MSGTLPFGEHPGIIRATKMVRDEKDREKIAIQFLPDSEPDNSVTIYLNWFGGAKPITARQIAALGYKGRLQAIHDGNSSLNGLRCVLVAKQGAPRTNGGFFTDYALKPGLADSPALSEDFDFATVGQEPPAGTVPAGW